MFKGFGFFCVSEWAPFYCSHVLQLPVVQLLWLALCKVTVQRTDLDFLSLPSLLCFHFTFHWGHKMAADRKAMWSYCQLWGEIQLESFQVWMHTVHSTAKSRSFFVLGR